MHSGMFETQHTAHSESTAEEHDAARWALWPIERADLSGLWAYANTSTKDSRPLPLTGRISLCTARNPRYRENESLVLLYLRIRVV